MLQAGNHRFSVISGIRNIQHEWNIKIRDQSFQGTISRVDDDWTDFVIGFSHIVPIAQNWSWTNRADMGFGDTEQSCYLATVLNWAPLERWVFNISARNTKLEIGEASDIDTAHFYYYDVDEPAFGIGFMYVW